MNKTTESYLDRYLPKIAKGAGIIFVGIILGRIAGYLCRLIVARGLGPESYGLISLGWAVLWIAVVFGTLGLPRGVVRYISLYRGRGDQRGIKGAITSSARVVLPLSLIVGTLLFLSSGWLSIHLFHDPDLVPVLRVMSVAVPLLALEGVLLGVMRGFQRMDYHVYCRNITHYFSRATLIALFIFLGYEVLGAALAYVIAPALGVILSFYLLQRNVFPFLRTKIKSSPQTIRLLAYSWPLMLVGIMTLITSWTDTLMLGSFKSAADVGFYNAARPTAQLTSAVPGAFGMIFFPVLSELYGRGKRREMGEVFRSVTKWVFMASLPVALLMILFSETILRVLFGPTYVVASTALSILAAGFLLFYLFMTSQRLLETIGRTKLVLLVTLTAASLNVVLNYLLIPPYGIEGAAIATSLSVALGGALAGLMAVHAMGFRPFRSDSAKVLLSGLTATLPIFLLSKFVGSGSSLLLIAGALAIFLSIYLSTLVVLGSFDRNDLTIVSALERRFGVNLSPIRRALERFM